MLRRGNIRLSAGQWALMHGRDSMGMSHLAKEKGVELGIAAVERMASLPGLNPSKSTRIVLKMSITERKPRALVAVQTALKGSCKALIRPSLTTANKSNLGTLQPPERPVAEQFPNNIMLLSHNNPS